VHIRGLLNVLAGCVDAQVAKFVYASGGHTLYRPFPLSASYQHQPIDEDTPLSPQWPQDISTLTGEMYVRYYTQQHGLSHLILRYADVYGEQDPACVWHPLSVFLRDTLYQRQTIFTRHSQDVRDHLFIDDAVRANLFALERGRNETVHISSGQGHCLHDFYHLATELLGSNMMPRYLVPATIAPTWLVLANERARHVLGWQPEISLASGLEKAMARLLSKNAEMMPVTGALEEPAIKWPVTGPLETRCEEMSETEDLAELAVLVAEAEHLEVLAFPQVVDRRQISSTRK
jgi:UDP-glucose 4-epimerase